MSQKFYSSFADLLANEDIELHKSVETINHKDENTANNRLFVWNFEEPDLDEFIQIFTTYKNEPANVTARQNLNGKLMRKMYSMLREGYNPVECMLYSSKVINMKLHNDKELQTMLAERIKDVYIKQESETIPVFENILEMWTWVPQLKVVIVAIGLIGDNENLLDRIYFRYAEDDLLRVTVFHAFLQNKSVSNLERAMKIILSLRDTNDDGMMGRIFRKEINGFGAEGMRIVKKYFNNPGISYSGSKVIRNIMLKLNDNMIDSKDEFYRNALAKNSKKDDNAYNDFLADCQENNDDKALYLCRYSRIEIGDYVKNVLEQGGLSRKSKNTAIVSLGILGANGYATAAEIVSAAENDDECKYAAMIAQIILRNEEYSNKLANILSERQDFELSDLYAIMKEASISSHYNAQNIIQKALMNKFEELIKESNFEGLEAFSSNLQMFWNMKLYSLISNDLLTAISNVLKIYAAGMISVPDNIIISLVETIIHSYNANVENVLFDLYHNAASRKIQQLSFKKLKGRQADAPK